MSLFSRARQALARIIAPPRDAKRAFNGAQMGRLYSQWITTATSADAEIRRDIRRLIDRSRDLERNNDYQRGFLLSAQRNILGAHKYDLRSDAGEWVSKKQGGKTSVEWQPDAMAKRMIEEAWIEWGKKGICTVDRKHNWRSVKRLAVRSVIRDGNFLARKIVGAQAGNPFGFALQIWEIDHLDIYRYGKSDEGNEIRFGIEFDSNHAPVAFWLRARHPGDFYENASTSAGFTTTRFPADEIYHLFLEDRAEQSIGYPWIVSAITRLRQLGAFEEAACIAARIGASKVGFFKKTAGDAPGTYEGETDANGHPVLDAAPGSFEELPDGWDLASWSPEYPNIETGDFRKAMLRGVCSSLGVSYTTLGNDLESVNFSSARVGLFDEREGWKELQLFFAEGLFEPIFADWLEAAIMNGALNLPLGKFAKFNRPVFKARRWAFIDPLKDITAAQIGIQLRTTSRRQIIEEQGGDVDEVFHDNLDDENLAESIGLDLGEPDDPEPPDPNAPEEDDAASTPPAKKAPPAS